MPWLFEKIKNCAREASQFELASSAHARGERKKSGESPVARAASPVLPKRSSPKVRRENRGGGVFIDRFR